MWRKFSPEKNESSNVTFAHKKNYLFPTNFVAGQVMFFPTNNFLGENNICDWSKLFCGLTTNPSVFLPKCKQALVEPNKYPNIHCTAFHYSLPRVCHVPTKCINYMCQIWFCTNHSIQKISNCIGIRNLRHIINVFI